ncbi:uncharacterized protein LOC121421000 [Lytechinus variegatus]|uniref:uncharacterized protein LOC121421000 n=1 Tax=Lytechinus variegatus TaxID=7654 RepID=UPI001BB2749A|nr:uncharacterized protein LOC121421000 [Lytechinus variegatus]
MLLDHPWEETLATSSTVESKELANNITYGINSTFTDQSSTFRDIFLGVDMFSFSNDDGGIRTSFQCIFGGSPSEDISTRHAFTELFIAELEDGFDDENFFDLELSADESVDVFRFIKL